jgi:ABC-type ATPase with predicted acetyltransferase domain
MESATEIRDLQLRTEYRSEVDLVYPSLRHLLIIAQESFCGWYVYGYLKLRVREPKLLEQEWKMGPVGYPTFTEVSYRR